MMHFRRLRSTPAGVELEEGQDLRDPSHPEMMLLGKEQANRVHMTLDGIPDHYARALEWNYLDRLPVQEIASRMGVQSKAAESLLTRAREAFRKTYESFHGRMGQD